jgi:hypothetical protein
LLSTDVDLEFRRLPTQEALDQNCITDLATLEARGMPFVLLCLSVNGCELSGQDISEGCVIFLGRMVFVDNNSLEKEASRNH